MPAFSHLRRAVVAGISHDGSVGVEQRIDRHAAQREAETGAIGNGAFGMHIYALRTYPLYAMMFMSDIMGCIASRQ